MARLPDLDRTGTGSPTLALESAPSTPAVRDHPNAPKVWVGGHEFVVADGGSGSVRETRMVERERGRAATEGGAGKGWHRDPVRMPARMPVR